LARDFAKFTGAFDKLTAACNACHEAANRGFIVIQRPATSAFPNQSFAPQRKWTCLAYSPFCGPMASRAKHKPDVRHGHEPPNCMITTKPAPILHDPAGQARPLRRQYSSSGLETPLDALNGLLESRFGGGTWRSAFNSSLTGGAWCMLSRGA
jgi:hypothetical protein